MQSDFSLKITSEEEDDSDMLQSELLDSKVYKKMMEKDKDQPKVQENLFYSCMRPNSSSKRNLKLIKGVIDQTITPYLQVSK